MIQTLSHLAGIYVEVFRSAPSIVLIYWFFFALPIIISVDFNPLTAAVLAVGLQAAAFQCEIFRGGIGAVPKGQWEAASALGMTRKTVFVSIVTPQALRNMLPMFLNQVINLIKATSLASVIAYGEIVYSAQQIASLTFRPIETYTLLGGIFFVLIFFMSLMARYVERRLQRSHLR